MYRIFQNKQNYHKVTSYTSRVLYFLASLSLILASLCLIFKALYELFGFVVIRGQIDKDLLDAISYAIIAIAVLDVGRYLLEEEVQRDKQEHTPNEAQRTFTRFMVVIAISVALEGLVEIFEAGNTDFTMVLYPLALVLCSVVIMVGLGIFLRLIFQPGHQVTNEQGQPMGDDSS